MVAFLEQFEGLEKLFMVCAVAGGILFAIRLVLQFLGGDTGGHHDISSPVNVGGTDIHGDTVADGSDAYLSFKLLSFQGLTAFFMMFGGRFNAAGPVSGCHVVAIRAAPAGPDTDQGRRFCSG